MRLGGEYGRVDRGRGTGKIRIKFVGASLLMGGHNDSRNEASSNIPRIQVYL